jgi:hypothetical protein
VTGSEGAEANASNHANAQTEERRGWDKEKKRDKPRGGRPDILDTRHITYDTSETRDITHTRSPRHARHKTKGFRV